MYLIGAMEILSCGSDRMQRFFTSLIPELTKLLTHDNPASRLVGYRADIDIVRGKVVHFLGIEMEQCSDFPAGMTTWNLTDDFIVITAKGTANSLPIKWLWEDISKAFIGEFTSTCFGGIEAENDELFWHMTVNSPISIDGIEDGDFVDIVEYQQSWPQDFEDMKLFIEGNLGDAATSVVHYGSTAIAEMPAKPVIDILVEVPSFELAAPELIKTFNIPECEYWWYDDHMIFIKREKPFGKRTHHIHIAPTGHRLWEGILFRDYLRSDSGAAAEYRLLKETLAAVHKKDREAYTRAKTDFIRKITAIAKSRHKSDMDKG
jgi:GrpB-like predicted nucleotidyltransferase (UPF0157 family)